MLHDTCVMQQFRSCSDNMLHAVDLFHDTNVFSLFTRRHALHDTFVSCNACCRLNPLLKCMGIALCFPCHFSSGKNLCDLCTLFRKKFAIREPYFCPAVCCCFPATAMSCHAMSGRSVNLTWAGLDLPKGLPALSQLTFASN